MFAEFALECHERVIDGKRKTSELAPFRVTVQRKEVFVGAYVRILVTSFYYIV